MGNVSTYLLRINQSSSCALERQVEYVCLCWPENNTNDALFYATPNGDCARHSPYEQANAVQEVEFNSTFSDIP